jgi:hypothetical protein
MGIVLASWGLFHMLIVGGAVTIFKNIEESEARIFMMGWVAQGGFLSFLGLTPPLLVWLFGMHQEIVRTTMGLCGVTLLMLSAHVYISGYSTHIKPIRIGTLLTTVYGFFLLLALFLF